MTIESHNVQTVVLGGQRFVILPEREYRRLCGAAASEDEPTLPPPDADGNYPAVASIRVLLAQDILRGRRAAGLSQLELAQRAGIRPETLNRIEKGKHTPSLGTVEKLDRVLAGFEAAAGPRRRTARTPARRPRA